MLAILHLLAMFMADRFKPRRQMEVEKSGEINPTVTAIGTASTYLTGWTAGAGVEVALDYNWLAKLEYLHVDLGSYSCGPCGVLDADHVSFKMDVVRIGLNYKFEL